jgi:isoleucyl-tRNA synthetase
VIQDTRKAAGLEVSDRIELRIAALDDADAESLTTHLAMIAGETLATTHRVSLSAEPLDSPPDTQRATIDAGQYANSGTLVIDVRKAGPVNV